VVELASAQTDKLTFKMTDKTVKEVLDEIEKQSSFIFFYSDGTVDLKKTVTLEVKNQSINQVLNRLFAGSDNTYVIKNRQVYINKKAPTSTITTPAESSKTITGFVYDETGEGLPYVSIVIKGSARGVATGLDGSFKIEVSPTDVLEASSLGYERQEIMVGNKTTINFRMKESEQVMQEVMVVGYGTQKKVSITGAVSSVQVAEMKVSSSTNLANALAGRITGLTSTQSAGGRPGADDATMYLRGVATINGSSPLILIDGVPRDNIRTIDPNEVESISILKDASATAVFGVQGANGVIMITTKRGKEGKPELSINVTQSYEAFTRRPARLHSLDYLRLRNEALTNDGQTDALFSQDVIDKYANPLSGLDPNDPDYEAKATARRFMYPDNDYYGMMFAEYTPQTVINANLTGGSDKTSYFMNVGYVHQGGNIKTEPESFLKYDPSMKLDRYSFRTNIDYKISSSFSAFINLGTYIEKVNTPLTANIYGHNQENLVADVFIQSFNILPISPGPLTIPGFGAPAGKLLDPSYLNSGQYMDRGPYEIVNFQGYTQEARASLNSTVGLNWDLGFITKGLSAKGQISYDSWVVTQLEFYRSFDKWRAFVNIDTDELSFSNILAGSDAVAMARWTNSKYAINSQASLLYNRTFDVHEISGMILAQRNYWETTGAEIPYNVLGIAARLTYNYDSRYFGEFNFGYNGSEQFAPKKRFGSFPAVSAGWVISNESFLKENDILSFLKLRASAGRVGNDKMTGGDRFLYMDDITVSSGYTGSLAAGAGIREGLLGNPAITWELAQKYNLGVDFKLFKDLSGSFEVFKEDRSQILIKRRSIPAFQGLPLDNIPRVNMGKVKNHGYEAELAYTKQVGKDWLIAVRGNFAYNRNERIQVDEVPKDNTYKYPVRETGYPIGQDFGYEINYAQDGGYWTPDALAAAMADPDGLRYAFGVPRVGDFVYVDANEDGIVDERDEAPIGYGSVPRISWGASLSLQYKGFDAYAFFQGLAQYSAMYARQGVWEHLIQGNYFDYHRAAWTEERWQNGDEITYPALSTRLNTNHVNNSFFVQDRSFARFKNAEIGYTLPPGWLKVAGVSKLRVFVNGQNLFTWSPQFRLTHLDPENDRAYGYPITRTFSFGANITF
jgi:TonB-linked SusC/RagA family outer membrane protein